MYSARTERECATARRRPGGRRGSGRVVTAVVLAGITAIAASAVARSPSAHQYRPQVHFSPLRNWMNDPNGLVYYHGNYHLFFQYNPYGSRWGHMSWGHAVSGDLLHWRELPVAIPEGRHSMIFSGSAVVDRLNTSGFGAHGEPPLVAIYTADPRAGNGPQTENLAYSTDGGDHWTKYAGNPVLDAGLRDFRDPKVFWYAPARHWVMVVARSVERRVSFYASADLKHWRHTGDFGPAGDVRGVWECPDLVELPVDGDPTRTRWVLKVDAQATAPGLGGGGQAFIGRFDGETFVDAQGTAQALDLGEDYYASLSWADLPGRRPKVITMAWMSNWLYAQSVPTSPWRGTMSLPRVLSLEERHGVYRLVQRPIPELRQLRGARRRLLDFSAVRPRTLLAVGAQGAAHEIRTVVEVGRRGQFVLSIGSADGRTVRVEYTAANERLTIVRSGQYGFSGKFDSTQSARVVPVAGAIELDAIIDRSSVEAFVNHGELTAAEQMFPTGGAYTVTVRTDGARIEAADVWRLHSVRRRNAARKSSQSEKGA